MIELTWHIEDVEGECENGAFEVEAACTVEDLRDAALADFEERSQSFEDWCGEPARLRVEFPCGVWLDLSSLLTSPPSGDQTVPVLTQNGG